MCNENLDKLLLKKINRGKGDYRTGSSFFSFLYSLYFYRLLFYTIPDFQIFLLCLSNERWFTLWNRVSASLKLPDTHRVRVVQVADLTRHILCWWPCIHLACSRLFTWINYMTLSKELLQVSIKVPALFKQKGWEPSNSTLLELSQNLIFYRDKQWTELKQTRIITFFVQRKWVVWLKL